MLFETGRVAEIFETLLYHCHCYATYVTLGRADAAREPQRFGETFFVQVLLRINVGSYYAETISQTLAV